MGIKDSVEVLETKISLPTYGIGKPEKNPIFSENRIYQGSSGVVYPHPVIEKICDEKLDKEYHAIFLENRYLKIMILPEIGGRVHMAYDKIKQRHFIYYNQVIKPALVGLTGPWISGGIEFNWPQHHRPSTFDPIDSAIERHHDGSITVWVSEVERMFRTKGMAGFRLYPDKAYLEINVKLYNRTPFPQTFLWWANPAVKVNDHYQSVFPPDVHAVFDHGKRDVSEFPIAKGTYYKVDYSPGTDISWYKNIPVPTSYMAGKSKYDFIGGYEHDTKGGILHVANHHIAPGKKQWTWGNGEFGFAWDRNLTDEDGPYVEIMTGVFSDNQPDFSWIQPNEERTFTQYFMPYSELGIVKNATKDGAINLEVKEGQVTVKLYTTSVQKNALLEIRSEEEKIWSEVIFISPENPFIKTVEIDTQKSIGNIAIALYNSLGRVIVQYKQESVTDKDIPVPACPAKEPCEIESIEQLYLTGLHIEQYRHATFKATDYYEEALRRESGDVRNNNALGLWLLRRGKFSDSENYFCKAIGTLTERNPNPYDSEPYFNLGLSFFMREKWEEAFEFFHKAVWSAAYQDTGNLYLARICCIRGNFNEALEYINKSLYRNYTSQATRHLKSAVLRKLNSCDEAKTLLDESLSFDKFNLGCLFENYLITKKLIENLKDGGLKAESLIEKSLSILLNISRGNLNSHMEYAIDYAHAGMYDEAIELLSMSIRPGISCDPMAHYYLGYFFCKLNDHIRAKEHLSQASLSKPDYCFPNRIEDVNVLEFAIAQDKGDSKALYYLGNFWYAHRQYPDAIKNWERSISTDDEFPTVHRNLAFAYHNKIGDFERAIKELTTAFFLDTNDGRILMELDQLYKKLNKPHQQRLTMLEEFISLTEERDDLYLERVTLYNQIGQFQKAKDLLMNRKFHPWEGGEGKVINQFLICHIQLAKEYLAGFQFEIALKLLNETERYPINLGEGKIYGTQENDIYYLKGCAYEGMGDKQSANEYFTKATLGLSEPNQAIYYNDQQPDKIFYQGLAWRKLGNYSKAESIFKKLINFGEKHLTDKIKIDYFAVSLPDVAVFDQDFDLKNRNHCHYLIGLGYLGLNNGKQQIALEHFNTVLKTDINHMGAIIHKNLMPLLVE